MKVNSSIVSSTRSAKSGALFHLCTHYSLASTPCALLRSVQRTRVAWHDRCRYNKAEQVVILSSTLDGGTYDLYGVGKEQGEQDARRGQGSYPVWVARNRFAVLDKCVNLRPPTRSI